MRSLLTRYGVIKEMAISVASLGIPISWLSGWLFGSGHYVAGILVGAGYLVIDNVASRLWFRVLEMMRK